MDEKILNSISFEIPETLSQSIYNCLKKAIIRNKIKPKEKLSEKEIAKSFNVSRTPVREALAMLAAEGFVKITSYRHVIVKAISQEELSEIFQVIGILDGLASTSAADNIDSNEIIKIKKMTNKLEYYYKQREIEKYWDINYEIHNRIWNHVTNSFLQKTLRNCLDHVRKCYYSLNSASQNNKVLEGSMKFHKEILEAINRKDKEKNFKFILFFSYKKT